MQKSSTDKIIAEVLGFLRAEYHVAVAGHVHERIIEQLGASHFHYPLLFVNVGAKIGIAEFNEIGQRGLQVGVPVSSTVVLEQTNLVCWRWRERSANDEDEEVEKLFHYTNLLIKNQCCWWLVDP